MSDCTYVNTARDGHGADWQTQCGREIYMEAQVEVGFALPPKPTDFGKKFCSWCGGVIKLMDDK